MIGATHTNPLRHRHTFLRHCLGNDEGSVALYFVVIATAMVFAAGVVIDGGRKMNGLAEAVHIADNAARACAQHVDETSARAGTPVLDVTAAVAAGNSYLSLSGHQGTIAVSATDPLTCIVTVRVSVATTLLPGPLDVQATQSATGLDERS